MVRVLHLTYLYKKGWSISELQQFCSIASERQSPRTERAAWIPLPLHVMEKCSQKLLLCQQTNSEEHGGRVDLQLWGSISLSLDTTDGAGDKDTKITSRNRWRGCVCSCFITHFQGVEEVAISSNPDIAVPPKWLYLGFAQGTRN